jgi:hypothetical protein
MPVSTRSVRPAPRRRKAGPSVGELVERLAALEKRLTRVEEGKAPPGDGRSAAKVAAKGSHRCIGCGVPLRRQAGRCRWCGRPL